MKKVVFTIWSLVMTISLVMAQAPRPILEPASSDRIVIEKLDGKIALRDRPVVFKTVDLRLHDWGLDTVFNKPTEVIRLNVFSLVVDADFNAIFNYASHNLSKSCLTMTQIRRFCQKYPEKLGKSGEERTPNLFLTWASGEYLVVIVQRETIRQVAENGVVRYSSAEPEYNLKIDVARFGMSYVWKKEFFAQVILPAE